MASDPAQMTRIASITHAHKNLLYYYLLRAFLAGPGFPVLMVYLYFRYHTLRYTFDREGVSMRWGILFRREINLTYARIQDIHLVSNLVERWLGLARIQIQTASGSSTPEMTIEGVLEFEELRDFLYARMHGVTTPAAPAAASPAWGDADLAGAVEALREATSELRAIRERLSQAPSGGAEVRG